MAIRRILVVGSANVDLVTRVPRIPKAGESLIGHSFATVCGGKGANQAVAAARLGARTHFAGCVGADGFGALQRETLGAEGIDLAHLKTHPEAPTGTAVILVAEAGENCIVVTPSANLGLRPADIEALAPLFADLDAVLVQLEIPLETVEATLRLARKSGVLGILDAGPAQAVPASILEAAGIVSPNETEAEAMTGVRATSVDKAREAAERLLEQGAREVVVKLGANGVLHLAAGPGSRALHVPAFTVDPVDTVAAGDACTAAMAVAWHTLPGGAPDLASALRFANAAGALATTRHGAQPSMPRRREVEDFLAKNGN